MKISILIKILHSLLFIICISACGDDDPTPRTFSNPPVTDQGEWVVNSNDYQDFMTIVAEIHLDDEPVCNVDDILAAFSGSDVRGVATPYNHLDCVLFNLIVYSNEGGEAITFGAYLSDESKTVACSNEITFEAGLGLGSPDTPYIIEIK
ncbi:MAG: hypothetical protein H8E70_02315 [Candidatus Marinimicrobia bacterium]|nr:hypothetical protein [Candidatus Neomarinimicrobiota bacterium]MBL6964586.1 hypothetical protein [Bacteroidota bacterium]